MQDIDPESVVMGALCKSPDSRKKYLDKVSRDDFNNRTYSKIFDAVLALVQSGHAVTIDTVSGFFTETIEKMQVIFLFDTKVLADLTPEVFMSFKQGGVRARQIKLRDYLDRELKKMTDPESLTEALRGMLANIEGQDSDIEVVEPDDAVNATEWLLDQWAAGERPVVSGLPELDERLFLSQFLGYWVIAGNSGAGKALALDTPVPTPSGWSSMGEVRIGDTIFDESGSQCQIINSTDVMYGRPCYRVELSDGTVFVADAEHRWETETAKARHSENQAKQKGRSKPRPLKRYGSDQTHKRTFSRVVTTEEISKTLRHKRTHNRDEVNHAILTSGPIQMPEELLPLSPYVLGAWLGDGSRADGRFTCAEIELLSLLRAEGISVAANQTKYQYNLKGIRPVLRSLGVLGMKHIPMSYRRSSENQRLALLQGLMDTDGTCCKRSGRCELTLTNRWLAENALELICSLGIKATMKESDAKLNGNVVGRRFRIGFFSELPVFRLTRKLARQKTSGFNGVTKRRYIVSCEKVDSVPVRCIEVNSPSHLFLVGKTFVPTHNSAMMCNIAKQNGRAGIPGTICSLEMSKELLLIRMAMEDPKIRGLELTERTIKNQQKMSDLKYAMNQFRSLPIFIIEGVNDIFRLDRISRKLAVDRGCKWTLFDYIQLGKTKPTDSDVVRVYTVSRYLQGLTKPDLPNGYHGQVSIALSQYSNEATKSRNDTHSVETGNDGRPQRKRTASKPSNSDLAWSGQIKQDADGILHIYPVSDVDSQVVDLELHCGKQRNYKSGWTVNAQFIKAEQRFVTPMSQKKALSPGTPIVPAERKATF